MLMFLVLSDSEDERVTVLYRRDQQGRTIRKSDNTMRTAHQLPLLAGKYTWRNSKLLGFPH